MRNAPLGQKRRLKAKSLRLLCNGLMTVRSNRELQPGLAIFEEYPELKDGKVKLDGDRVVEFPKLPEFQQVTLKVMRWEERDKRLVIKEAQMVA